MKAFMKRHATPILLIMTAASTSCASGPGPDAKAQVPPGFQVHGHRGARARRPENTLPAFEYALQVGVDYLEMDLAVTKDGVLVISHDPHINPTICTGPKDKDLKPDFWGNGPLIHDLTLKQVKQYDCGAKRNPKFPQQTPVPGTRIPTLEEVFELVRTSPLPAAKRVKFNIETKIFPDHPNYTVSPEVFSEKAVEAFRRSGFLDRIILQSFDPRTLVISKKLEPHLTTVMLIDEGFREDLVATTLAAGAEVLSPYFPLLNRKVMQRARDAKLQVVPWTLDKPSEWQDALDLQVDGIITDDPEALIHFLHQ